MSTEQQAANVVTGEPVPWPDRDEILALFDVNAGCRDALADVTPGQFAAAMKAMGNKPASRLAAIIGMRGVSKVTTPLAGRILDQIRKTGNSEAIADLLRPGLNGFNAHPDHRLLKEHGIDPDEGLSVEDEPLRSLMIREWLAFLDRGVCDLHVHASSTTLSMGGWVHVITDNFPFLERAILVEAVRNCNASIPALTLLAALDPAAAAAHAVLSKTYPDMPPVRWPLAYYGRYQFDEVHASFANRVADLLLAERDDAAEVRDGFCSAIVEYLREDGEVSEQTLNQIPTALRSWTLRAAELVRLMGEDDENVDTLTESLASLQQEMSPRAAGASPAPDAVTGTAHGQASHEVHIADADRQVSQQPSTERSGKHVNQAAVDEHVDLVELDALVSGLDWTKAGEAAGRVVEAIDEFRAPDLVDVEHVHGFAAEVHRLAQLLTTAVGNQVPADAASMVDAVISLTDDNEDIAALEAMASATGPAAYAEALAAVRELAVTALDGNANRELIDGLVALHDLALAGQERKAGVDIDFATVDQWNAKIFAGLPAHTHMVASVAIFGEITPGEPFSPPTASEVMAGTAARNVAVFEESDATKDNPASDDEIVEASREASSDISDETDEVSVETTEDAATQGERTRDAESMPEAGAEADEHIGEAAEAADEQSAAVDPTVDPTVDPVLDPALAPTLDRALDAELDAELDAALGAELDAEALEALLRAELAATAPPAKTPKTTKQRETAETTTSTDATPGAAETDTAVALREAEARLLAAGRYGLAAELHNEPAHRAARAMAAYQQHLTTPAGDLAAAFADAATLVTRDAIGDDRPGQLLAWAAAVRVAVVAPAVGAAAVLDNLQVCVQDYPALTAVGTAFTKAALAGAIVVPEAARAISAVDEVDTRARDAAARAAALVEGAPRRAFKYTGATLVYQNWMNPDGDLGALLRTVSEADPAAAADVLARVTRLRGTAEKAIDDVWASRRGSSANKKKKIDGGARSSLINTFNGALDVAATWAENTTAADERRTHWSEDNRSARPLDNLRNDLGPVKNAALAELEGIGQGVDSADASVASEASAARAAHLMLNTAFQISEGHPPVGPEPTPAYALRGDLLGTGLDLDPHTLEPVAEASEVVTQVVEISQTATSPQVAYQVRADRGEHDLTELLLANLAVIRKAGEGEVDEVATLRTRREADVAKKLRELRARIEKTESLIRLSQRDATLPDDVAGTLAARVEAAKESSSRNFRELNAVLDSIEQIVDEHRNAEVASARARIESEENADVVEHRDLLLALVDKGEVAGALEYLEQLITEGQLPQTSQGVDHFGKFFPAVPTIAAANKDLLRHLRDTIENNGKHADVTELVKAAGVDLTALSETQRHAATKAIGAWGAGVNGRDVTSLLRPIFALAGYEFLDANLHSSNGNQGRYWARLTGVRAVGNALSPALGSQMSASGASLRVLILSKPATPAMISEWVRNERQEETIVVLHLTGSFSPDQRRALANISRGRPRPVAVLFDPAVAAYLAVQPEPSRATFAAMTLPFTADSPYRALAGRTAPEMFYGRVAEKREVVNLNGPSFVSGGRQLGKSALLWSAKELFESDYTGAARAVFLEIRAVGGSGDPELLWPKLLNTLIEADIVQGPPPATVDGETVTSLIKAWLDANLDRQLLILLDEADLFLEADAENNRFVNISLCKNLMESTGRRVKFVFAGLHRTARFESLPNQPLAHMGRPIIVGPLKPQAAHDLLTKPLAALGYRFADPRLQPARILAFTNNVPSLLQLFGRALIERLNSRDLDGSDGAAAGPPTVITDDDITAVLEDTNLLDQFRGKYLLTLELDNRYKVIVYAVAYNALENLGDPEAEAGVTLADLEQTCRYFWPEGFADVNLDHLRSLVAECVDLGVLAHSGGRYRMRTQTMLRLLGTYETIEETLVDASARLALPSGSEFESHRAPLPGSMLRSPLTSRQLSQILNGGGRCFVVAGSPGLGIAWAAAALDHLETDSASRGRSVSRLSTVTPAGLAAKLARSTCPSVVTVEMRTASSARLMEMAETATRTLGQMRAEANDHAARARADVVVVIVADLPAQHAWHRVDQHGADLVEITRVTAPTLRWWCEESSAPFAGPGEYQRLLAATGGWPRQIESALTYAIKQNASSEATFQWLARQQAAPAKAVELVTEAGLLPEGYKAGQPLSPPPGASAVSAPVVAAMLRSLFLAVADLTGGAEPDAAGEKLAHLIELLEIVDAPATLASLTGGSQTMAEAAVACGFTSVEEAMLALGSAGAFVAEANGNLRCEPVLVNAVAVVTGEVEK